MAGHGDLSGGCCLDPNGQVEVGQAGYVRMQTEKTLVIVMRRYLICLLFTVASPFAMADWQILSDGSNQESDQYIDLQKVKQAGPMAIYRQVEVLSQGPKLVADGVLSTLALYEYDCMNAKFRLLQISGFSRQWAEGQITPLARSSSIGEWLALPLQPLGQRTYDLVCPGGKDN